MPIQTMQFKVPSIVCQGCADTITEIIKTEDPDAQVAVDIEKKIVNVETGMSESSVRQSIVSVGHEVA